MDKAKALTGKYAGQPIAANKQKLTHELCREWKLYCPECYQFVHLRQSYKIKSYFAHYDVEDKSCNYRETSSNESAKDSREASAKGQDLESIQQEFESILSRNCEGFDNEINEVRKKYKEKNLENITDECIRYFIKNKKNIIQVWLLEDYQNNDSKHKEIYITVLNILSIAMNRCILKKLIHYAIAINRECHQLDYQLDNITKKTSQNKNCIESNIRIFIKIIAGINWIEKNNKCRRELGEINTLIHVSLYPENFYLDNPRKILNTNKTLDKELENRGSIYRVSDLPKNTNIEGLKGQSTKSNGKLREFKTPNGLVGSAKKTKSKILSGGKSTNNVDVPIFNKGEKWNHPKLGLVQLTFNPNSGEIDLLNYNNGKIIKRVAKINGYDGEYYEFSLYLGSKDLVEGITQRINNLIQPKKSDGKGNINLPQLKILDGLKQQKIQQVTEEKFGHHISSGTVSKVRSKAWKYLNNLANKESHPLHKALIREDWQEVFNIMASLGLISKRTAK